MELKVWVDGLQRVVCGLAERTTCQEVIYALAHATQKTGRFVLVEKWRKSERSLSPLDRPLELLSKWGEHASDIQFVLRCLEDTTQQRPSSAVQQQQVQQRSKFNNGENQNDNHARYRRMNNSLDESSQPNGVGGLKSVPATDGASSTTTKSAVLKPYFVDTSNPTPESGTLVRPTSQLLQQPASAACYEAASSFVQRQNAPVRRTGTLSPTPLPPSASSSQQYNAAVQQRTTTMATNGDNTRRAASGMAANGGSLTVLSQSAHESLNSPLISSSSFDSSGTTLYLDQSSSSNVPSQLLKQLDISQNSFCSSSVGSNASSNLLNGSSSSNGRMNGSARPPPPSYDAFVQRRNNREHLLMANRSRQGSPAPNLLIQQGLINRSRTPVVPGESMNGGSMTKEQLIKIIEGQQYQIQAQFQTMRSYDIEIAQRESDDQRQHQQTPVIDHIRRELQQLEVERVHVKQKVEELRRQDLDSQLVALRRDLTDISAESMQINEKIQSMDHQLMTNDEKIRSITTELERERGFGADGMNGQIPNGVGLNDSFLASNEAFEARIRNLDEMLKEKRRQVDSESKNHQSKLLDMGNQRPVENVAGVWV